MAVEFTRQMDPHVEDLGVVSLRLVHGEVDAPLQPPQLHHVLRRPPDGILHQVVPVGTVRVRSADEVDELAVVQHLQAQHFIRIRMNNQGERTEIRLSCINLNSGYQF